MNVSTYHEFRTGPLVQLRDERLEDEYPRKQASEDCRKEQNNGQAREDAELPDPPRDGHVLRPALLHAERAIRAPAHRQDALLEPPPLDEGHGPDQQKRRVDRRIRLGEKVVEYARGRDKYEELGVRGEEGEVEGDGFAELSGVVIICAHML